MKERLTKIFCTNILDNSIINESYHPGNIIDFRKQCLLYLDQCYPFVVRFFYCAHDYRGIAIVFPAHGFKAFFIDLLRKGQTVNFLRSKEIKEIRALGYEYIAVRNVSAFKLIVNDYLYDTIKNHGHKRFIKSKP